MSNVYRRYYIEVKIKENLRYVLKEILSGWPYSRSDCYYQKDCGIEKSFSTAKFTVRFGMGVQIFAARSPFLLFRFDQNAITLAQILCFLCSAGTTWNYERLEAETATSITSNICWWKSIECFISVLRFYKDE